MAFATTDIFKQCCPALRTDIARCGSTSLCTASKPESAADLDTIYKLDDEYRVLGAMLMTSMELKACGIVEHPLRDFFMANLRPVRKNIQPDDVYKTARKVKPFILAEQKRPINNNYWKVTDGQSSGENWMVTVESTSGIPANAASFTIGERVFIKSKTQGGTINLWQGVVLTSTLNGDTVDLVLTPQNDGSSFDVEDPTTGRLTRGPANIARSEAYCDAEPTYINTNLVPFWIEHTKTTLCNSSVVREWRTAIMANNPMYAKLFAQSEAESNGQKLAAWMAKVFENFLWGKPISDNQNVNDYRSLPQVTRFIGEIGLGYAGGTCDGYKANALGIFEILNRCQRVYDAQGATLDLWALIDAIYRLSRVRAGVGSAGASQFDLFTDRDTAGIIDRGFIGLFKEYSQDTLRINMEAEGDNLGFHFKRYKLVGKGIGITLNVMTHFSLDDYMAMWEDYANELNDATVSTGGRVLWLLDMTGITMGVVESTRQTSTSGRLEDLQRVDPAYQCIEDTATREVEQRGLTYTNIVDCPQANLVIWNLGGSIPAASQSQSQPDYLATGDVNCYY